MLLARLPLANPSRQLSDIYTLCIRGGINLRNKAREPTAIKQIRPVRGVLTKESALRVT